MTAPEDREWTDDEVRRLDSTLKRYYPATAEDREIARTAPAWWTGADVSQTELPPDVADIIAGALQTSRAHAYELMRDAVEAIDAATEGVQHGEAE